MMRSLCLSLIAVFCLHFLAAGSGIAAEEKGGSLGTATVGGTFYVWAGPWTQIAAKAIPNYQISVEVTGGPVHNMKLVHSGELEFGLMSMPAAYEGYKGLGWAEGKRYDKVRVLFPMYPSYATPWALDKSGIRNFRDLEGKIFAPGPKGGTPEQYYRIMLDILGVKPKKIVNTGMSDLPGQMTDGLIDAAAGTGGEPFGPAQETDATSPVKILEWDQADLDKITKELPSFFIGMRPAGGYKLFTEPQPTLQYWNIYACNNDLSDDLAYKLTKCFFENLEHFENIYAPTCDTKPIDILKSAIPLHRGAAKFYREQGVEIPASLLVD